jgi:hypothetical protein
MAAKSCWRTINLKDVLGFSVSGRFIDLRQENDIFNRFGETIYGSLTKSMIRAMETEQGEAQMGIEEDINEAIRGGSTNARPDSSKTTFENKTIELGKNLFKLGSDKINTNSEEFKKAVELINQAKAKTITIQGGASSVGKSYDNKALADRRANNFKTALQSSGIDTSKMNIIPGIVTPNTDVPNSPEANKAQFVRFTMTGTQMGFSQQTSIDNLATANKVIPINKVKVKSDTKSVPTDFMDVRIIFPKDKTPETILKVTKYALYGYATQVNRIK